jgi:DNA-binding MarR family transcriptional regulator
MQCSLTEPRDLVEKQADPSDGRKSLVSATAAGRQLGRDSS